MNGAEKDNSGLRRYSLQMPSDEFEKVEDYAKAHGKSVKGVIEQFTRLGLEIQRATDAGEDILIRTGEKETSLKILW